MSRAGSVLVVHGTSLPFLRLGRLGAVAGAASWLIFCWWPTNTVAQSSGNGATGLNDLRPASDPAWVRRLTIDPFASAPTLQAQPIAAPGAEVTSLISGGETEGEIAFEALALPLRGASSTTGIPWFVEIDGPSLLRSNPSGSARVELYANVLGSDQRTAAFISEAFTVDLREMEDVVWQDGLKYYGYLSLPPGEYQLAILVRNLHSASASVRVLDLQVPAGGRNAKPQVVPVFSPPTGRDVWLSVRGAQPSPSYPWIVSGQAISPMVRPVLIAGRRSQSHLFTCGLAQGDRGRIELLQGGSVVAAAVLAIGERHPGPAGGVEILDVGFDSPRVPPGLYKLRVVFADGARSLGYPVLIAHQDTRERGLVWTDLRGSVPGAVGAFEETRSQPQDKHAKDADLTDEAELRIIRLAAAYRDALTFLAQNQSSAARTAVLEVESSVLIGGTLEELQTAQLRVAQQLAGIEVESLLPVLVLHDDLYMTYRQRKLFSLGFNSRALIEKLAELYAELGGTEGSRIVAARALASLAGRLQESNLPSNSRRLYRRTLDYDPHSKVALLGLAISYERYGEYSLAVTFLEALVAAHPRFGEGLLRLAINLDRLGVHQRSKELFDRVLDTEAPDWVRSLAFQESARALIEADQLDQAATLLERSLEELPEQYGTIYLLSHVYDRRREAYRALELIQLMPSTTTANVSPRKVYDSWPEAALEQIRSEISQAAAVRTSLLARALGISQSMGGR